jgi:hypothetical protein
MSYDVNEFYTHASDKKGHHATVQAALLPECHQLLSEIIASGKVPAWKTIGDAIRDSLRHRIEYVKENCLLDIDAPLSEWDAAVMARKLRERYENADRTVEDFRIALSSAQQSSTPAEVDAVRKMIEAALNTSLPEQHKQRLRNL